MESEVFIHIGFAKTGTTWLQEIVFPEWMRENNVLLINKISIKDFCQQPRDKILITNERFRPSPIWEEGTNSLKNLIRIFGKIKVIITFRDIDALVDSYNLHARLGGLQQTTDQEWMDYYIQTINFLKDHDIEYCYLDPLGFPHLTIYNLAKFMDIKMPSPEQINKWILIKANVRRKQWAYPLADLFVWLHWNWGRKMLVGFIKPKIWN